MKRKMFTFQAVDGRKSLMHVGNASVSFCQVNLPTTEGVLEELVGKTPIRLAAKEEIQDFVACTT